MPEGIDDPKLVAAMLLLPGAGPIYRTAKTGSRLIASKGLQKGVAELVARGRLRAELAKVALDRDLPERAWASVGAKERAGIAAGGAGLQALTDYFTRKALKRERGPLLREGEIDRYLKEMGGTVPSSGRRGSREFSTAGQPAAKLIKSLLVGGGG